MIMSEEFVLTREGSKFCPFLDKSYLPRLFSSESKFSAKIGGQEVNRAYLATGSYYSPGKTGNLYCLFTELYINFGPQDVNMGKLGNCSRPRISSVSV